MKIFAYTADPKALYDAINYKIEKEKLKTWEIKLDSEKDIHYNHTPDQWSDRALIKPILQKDYLEFKITWWKNNKPEKDTKGYYLGRFTEILMVHFRDLFDSLKIDK